MSPRERVFGEARSRMAAALACAGVGWAGVVLGLVIDPRRTYFAYLTAYAFGITIALGALCLVMIAHATNAQWFVVLRRLAEAPASSLPIFLLLFLPLLGGLHELYPWVGSLAGLEHPVREAVLAKRAWLNVPFFLGRAAVYLVLWSALAVFLARWSLLQDAHRARLSRAAMAGVSGAGLMLFGFTLTFAAFDWIMSLAPGWQSAVFGAYVFAGGIVSALALLVVVTRRFELRGELRDAVAASHYYALGRLLFAFVCFWAWMAYSQGFLIWIADLPHEATYYIERWRGGWRYVLIAILIGHFGLPFLILLSRTVKRSGRALACVGAWMLLMHYVDVFWLVVPELGPGGGLHWLDAAALLAVAGTAVSGMAYVLAGRPVVPRGDPELPASMEYHST